MSRLAELLFGGDADPASLLLHAGGEDQTLGEVRSAASDVARALVDAGVGPGTPVGVMLPNRLVVPALFGVWRAGGAYVPLNPRLGASDLEHVLDGVDPGVIVTTPGEAERFPDRTTLVMDGGISVLRPDSAPGRTFEPEVALIQLTSGTTGRPKPVLLTEAGVLQLLDGVISTLRTNPRGDRPPMPNLIPVSLSLWAGIYQVLFARLVGAPVVVMDQFEPRTFADLVSRFDVRSTVLPPAAMTALCDEEAVTSLAPLKYVRSITAPLSPLQARRFRDRFGLFVLNCYGQTEIGGEIIGWSAADAKAHGDDKLGAVGRPHDRVDVRTDPESGELQVRTPSLSAGYADGSGLADRLTDDGWFRTGDIGHEDGDGFVWIEGRRSDMINRGGQTVFPAVVVEVLRLSSSVADVAVAGVADDRLGEVPWAFFVESAPTTSAELEDLCRRHLAPYKVPVRFVKRDELPRNEIGKVLTRELVESTRPAR